MRKKGPSKTDKNKHTREKRYKKNSNLSSKKPNEASSQIIITARKIPKIFSCSGSSNHENNISLINQKTNSSKDKTRISTDISIGNDLFKQTFQYSNNKKISPFNLQKVNTNMDIFIPSEPNCINCGFSSKKKLKTSLINSPNYSDLKNLENTDSITKSYSLNKFINNNENLPNKNLNEVYSKNLNNKNNSFCNVIPRLNNENTDKLNDKYEEIIKNLNSNSNSFDYYNDKDSISNSKSKEKKLRSSNKENNIAYVMNDSNKNINNINLNFSNNNINVCQNIYCNNNNSIRVRNYINNNFDYNNHCKIKNTNIINNNLLSIKEINNIDINIDNKIENNHNLIYNDYSEELVFNINNVNDDFKMCVSDNNNNNNKNFEENQILENKAQIICNNFFEIEENLGNEIISNLNNTYKNNFKSNILKGKDNREINKIDNNSSLIVEKNMDTKDKEYSNNLGLNNIQESNNINNDIEIPEIKILENDSNHLFINEDKNMYFNFNNVDLINTENILIDNNYTHYNYDILFNNIKQSNNLDINLPNINNINNNSFRITNIIRPKKKTFIEIDNDINDNRFLYEKDINTCIRKNCNYMENNQKFIKPKMRKILLDWIQEISAQLNFKRSTYHLSISILDMFLSKFTDLEVDRLQLIGVTCLIIAAKYEEIIIPSIHQMASATESACTYQDIIDYERLILNTLEWSVNVTNFSTWINETTLNWDNFIDSVLSNPNEFMLNVNLLGPIRFRIPNNHLSLMLFKMFSQYIDLISLDVEYLYYSERILCLSVIYILILKYFNLINLNKIPYLKLEHVNHLFEFNLLFDRFLNQFYSLEFINIFDHIQYASCFIYANLHFDEMDLGNIIHWEEFLQIQTFNPNNDRNEREAAQRKSILRQDNNNNL